MPYPRRKPAYRRRAPLRKNMRKPIRGRRYGAKLTTSIVKNSLVRPEKLRVKMPYVDYYTITCPSAGVGTTRTWNLNSIWDPDRSGIGHSAQGWSQWQYFYSKYRVYGVSYEFAMTNFAPDTNVAGTLESTSYVPAATFSTVDRFEQPKSRKFTIGNREGNSKTTIRGYIKVPYVVGETNEQYRTNDQNVSVWNGNPLAQACLNLNLLSLQTTSPAGVTVYMRLVYHVECFDAIPLGDDTRIAETSPSMV